MSKLLYCTVNQLKACHATFVCNFGVCWAIFKVHSLLNSAMNFAIKPLSCFPPHLTYAALPCETLNATFAIFPLQLLQKHTSKFIYFLVNVIHIIWLNRNCLPCVRSTAGSLSYSGTCVSSMSAHSLRVSVSHFNLLKWETPTFILSGLWSQHPDVNFESSEFVQKYSKEFTSKKYITCTDWHYGMSGNGFEPCINNNVTDDWHRRLQVCVHIEGGLPEYLVWLQIITCHHHHHHRENF